NRINELVRHGGHARLFSSGTSPPLKTGHCPQGCRDLGGNQFLRCTPLEESLDPADLAVDVAPGPISSDHLVSNKLQLSRSEFTSQRSPEQLAQGTQGTLDCRMLAGRKTLGIGVVALGVLPVKHDQFRYGRLVSTRDLRDGRSVSHPGVPV